MTHGVIGYGQVEGGAGLRRAGNATRSVSAYDAGMEVEPDLPPFQPSVCGVCGRVLDHRDDIGFVHTVGDAAADHDPMPVPMDEALVVAGRCDFCYADYPEWVIPAREFEALPGHMSSGDWAACEECIRLIDSNQWSALQRRAAQSWLSRHGEPMAAPVLANLPRLYRLLRSNITGSKQPNPSVAQMRESGRYGHGWKSDASGG